jgi:glycosyltransferase involved in cell wall biosynthesis
LTRPIKLALLSSGLGRITRGFEITTSRWFDCLKDTAEIQSKLYSGGKCQGAVSTWNVPRDFLLNSPLRALRRLNERGLWEFCYTVEQVTFSLCLPDLLYFRPDVVWTKEVPLAHFLLAYKYLFGLRYKIIFANGGAFRPATYKDFDYVQHLHPDSLAEAENFGLSPSRMQLLPNCVFYEQPSESRIALRSKYGFSSEDWVIVCVAAWNSFQKRLDYLIDEVALLDEPNLKLLLCGQPELETAELKAMAQSKLGNRAIWKTLTPTQVHEALSISDVFVLPSFREGLASSIIEAAMAGLPVLSHPHAGGKFILQDEFWWTDMSLPGSLSAKLRQLKVQGAPAEKLQKLQSSAYARFSREALSGKFVDMVRRVSAI